MLDSGRGGDSNNSDMYAPRKRGNPSLSSHLSVSVSRYRVGLLSGTSAVGFLTLESNQSLTRKSRCGFFPVEVLFL